METNIVRKGEGRFLLEGEECTEVYFKSDKIIFSVSTLLPGQKACIDKGHEGSDEVCYVISGTIIIILPDKDEYHLLNKGDAILIPPG